ncbi:sulfotransferase family 2 domain-containing protein [Algirhabdus cladophorae]|uniref:sulfotransferase family 2 domain-containing protein n=1 Tax=Algirhabdus cladophorae TaxID=3377108 RepID=UPI003B846F3D
MLVSVPGKFIYIKTLKTASTSIEMALQPWCQDDPNTPVEERNHASEGPNGIVGQRMIGKDKTELDKKWSNHMPAAKIKELIDPEVWETYTKIHSVRNPFDKVVSGFFWKTTRQDLQYDGFDEAKVLFEDYVMNAGWQTDYELVHIDDGYCGDMAIRYETMIPDLKAVVDHCGLPFDKISLPETKVTTGLRMGREVAEFYTPKAIAEVQRRCDWIFERFGYTDTPDQLAPN